MQAKAIRSTTRLPSVSAEGILFLYSPNLVVKVHFGSLDVDLGRGVRLSVSRAGEPRLKRLILCGHGGVVTLAVPAWLADIGATYMHVDLYGRVLGEGPSRISPDLSALRRAQALASGTEVGQAIAVHLLDAKLAGQGKTLASIDRETDGTYRDQLRACTDAKSLRLVESHAANAFWRVVADRPFSFAPADQAKVPRSWRTVGRRGSTISGASPRKASTPAHAIWNYAYALAAGEVSIGLRATGLDPGISATGLHADTPNRDSCTYDVVEVIRPVIDAAILAMIDGRKFRRRDFAERPDGTVRLTAALARELTEAILPLARNEAASYSEWLARALADSAGNVPPSHIGVLPTNLTSTSRRRGRADVRNPARAAGDAPRESLPSLVPNACQRCGVVLAGTRRTFCDECLPGRRAEVDQKFAQSGPAALAKQRAEGKGPMSDRAAKARMGASIGKRNTDNARWLRENPGPWDPEVFRREIQPGLAEVTITLIMQATGLSRRHSAQIRRGEALPHPQHWDSLSSLVRE